MEETKKKKSTKRSRTIAKTVKPAKVKTRTSKVVKKTVSKKKKVVRKLPAQAVKKNTAEIFEPAILPPLSASVPAPINLEPAPIVPNIPPVERGLSFNRTKLWAAVAITMTVIVMVWVYALPYNITVPGGDVSQLSQVGNNNISQMMSDIQHSWNNLTQQAVNLNATTSNTNTTMSVPSTTTTNQPVNRALPTNEELDDLFSDIN